MGQGQLPKWGIWNMAIWGLVWHTPIGHGAFWNMGQEVAQMTGPGGPGDGFPSIDNLRELRLRALLNDLVNERGPGKAAEALGVDRKTLRRG